MYIDISVSDIYFDMSESDKDEMRQYLEEDKRRDDSFSEYLDYLRFRLNNDPSEYSAMEVLDLMQQELERQD